MVWRFLKIFGRFLVCSGVSGSDDDIQSKEPESGFGSEGEAEICDNEGAADGFSSTERDRKRRNGTVYGR